MSLSQIYWAVWLTIFGIGESLALWVFHAGTLSETVWNWFKVVTGQPIRMWSAPHYFLAVFLIWLLVHLVFRIWR